MSVTQRAISWPVSAYVAGFTALEGHDQLGYGGTVPSLLANEGMGAKTATAGVVGSGTSS